MKTVLLGPYAEEDCLSPSAKLRRTEEPNTMQGVTDIASQPDAGGSANPAPSPETVDLPAEIPSDNEDVDIPKEAMCCEISFDVFQTDVVPDEKFLWTVLEECAAVDAQPGQKRRVEVSFRKLNPSDCERFRKAMHKERQSWLRLPKCGGSRNPASCSRWVVTWKKSSDSRVGNGAAAFHKSVLGGTPEQTLWHPSHSGPSMSLLWCWISLLSGASSRPTQLTKSCHVAVSALSARRGIGLSRPAILRFHGLPSQHRSWQVTANLLQERWGISGTCRRRLSRLLLR